MNRALALAVVALALSAHAQGSSSEPGYGFGVSYGSNAAAVTAPGTQFSNTAPTGQDADWERYLGYGARVLNLLDPLFYTDQERARGNLAQTMSETDLARARAAQANAGAMPQSGMNLPLVIGGVVVVGWVAYVALKEQ